MTSSSPGPSDEDLDRLLSTQVRRTRPEFEQRWRELRGTFNPPRHSRSPWRWAFWPGLATAAALAVLLTFELRTPAGPSSPGPLSFEELVALDSALSPARPLLQPETREAVINLPARSS